jgi:hypothetical protein
MAQTYGRDRASKIVSDAITRMQGDVSAAQNQAIRATVNGSPPEQSKATFDAKIVVLFDYSRFNTIAITETTFTISVAENDAAVYAGQQQEEEGEPVPILIPYWITEQDDHVCEICSPLNDRPRSIWARLFSFGPPGHPNCRCRLRWRPL